jgi:hypothetical protein
MILFTIDIIKDKIEEATGTDLDKDGRVGGGGLAGQAEKATHIDLNHDGVIGGRAAPAGGGKLTYLTKNISKYCYYDR